MILIRNLFYSILVFFFIFLFAACKKSVDNRDDSISPPLINVVNTDSAVTLYLTSRSNKLLALNAWDGSIKWTAKLGGNRNYSSPIYANGSVYVGSGDNKLYAFDTSGNLRWSAPVSSQQKNQSPIVSDGIVYLPCDDAVYAFTADKGNLIWKFPTGSNNIIIKNNTIFINNYYLYAIDATTGNQKWKYITGTYIPPVVFTDRIYVINDLRSAFGDSIIAVNTTTGQQIWGKQYSDLWHVVELAVKNGNIYCASEGYGTYGFHDRITIYDSASGTRKIFSDMFQLVAGVYSGHGDNVNLILTDSIGFITSSAYYIYLFNSNNLQINATSFGSSAGYTVVKDIIYSTYPLTNFYGPSGGYNAGFVVATDYKKMTLKWSKEIRDIDFVSTAPCVVTKSGTVYRGGVISY